MERQLDIIAYLIARIIGKIEDKPVWDILKEATDAVAPRKASAVKPIIVESTIVDKIYKLYPTICPVSGRSLGKCSKNKKQIATLLKTRTPEEMELIIREYIVDCKNHNTYVKNFSTFLNQLPDKRESPKPAAVQQPAPAEKRSPELMAIDAMHQGMTDASVVAQGIRFVWGDGITEERINSALFNAGYQV